MKRQMAGPNYAPATDTGGGVRDAFRQAFAAAKETHANPEAAAATGDDDDEDLEDDEDAGGDDDVEDDDEPADDGEAAKDEKPAKVAKTDAADKGKKTADESLLTDEEFTALQEKHKDDPAALRRSLEGAFTQKTQRLASERKSLEHLSQYAGLIDALENDTEATLLKIAKQNGIDLGKGATRAKDADETAVVASVSEAAIAKFKTALGPDLDYLADAIAPALQELVESLAGSTVSTIVEPLKKQTKVITEKQAAEQTDAIMKTFETKYPDWKDHETAMMAVAKKINPQDMTEGEFLEHLYKVVTRDTWEADREKNIDREVASRVKKTTAKLNTAESGDAPRGAVPEGQVKKRPAGKVTFREAARAAMRGERFDDEDDDD